MNPLKIAFIPIARKTFDIPLAESVTAKARAHLESAGYQLVGPDDLVTDLHEAETAVQTLAGTSQDLVVVFQATFADSSMLMAVAEARLGPLFLWAVPEDHTGGRLRLNSFCGINLGGHALTRVGVDYAFIFASPGDPEVLEKITPLARAGRAITALRGARLGRVGENPDGFETCLLDPDQIKKRFGLDVVQFDLAKDIFPQAREADPGEVNRVYDELDKRVQGLGELEPVSTRKSIGVYTTLKNIAQEQDISGYAVRCWPEFFTELGCAACGAMSMLSDELTPCSCEADVNGTITQMLLQAISGEQAFGTDMVSLDEERDAMVVWHCGLAPLSMADPERQAGVTIHSNRKLPLLFEFTLKPGRVTIARLTESSGEYRLVIGSGNVVRGPMSFTGTSGLIKFDNPAKNVLNLILTEGLEHHISITYGDHVEALAEFAKLQKIPILQLTN